MLKSRDWLYVRKHVIDSYYKAADSYHELEDKMADSKKKYKKRINELKAVIAQQQARIAELETSAGSKLVKLKKELAKPEPKPATTKPPVEKKPRKPRSDKGQPRKTKKGKK